MAMGTVFRGVFVKGIYPLLYLAARTFGVERERLQRLLIDTNNTLVRKGFSGGARRILLLLPHCLQWDKCNIRVTSNIFNCAGCGKCEIKDLIEIAEKYQLDLYVATGGTLARRVVVETKPEAIIAVACEHDLSSGISDTYPLPILGVLNDRPFGPCFNTRVDMGLIEEALLFFIGDGAGPAGEEEPEADPALGREKELAGEKIGQ